MKVAVVKANSYETEDINKALDRLFEVLHFNPDNPFADIVRPGDRVFIKPNWVAHEYRKSCPWQDDIYSVITHPALIEAVADRVAKALDGKGEIIIGDNPSIDADFDALMKLTNIRRLADKYSVPCRIIDLRPLRCVDLKDYGKKHRMQEQSGDPLGETKVDLGTDSLFYGINPLLFRGVFTNRWETIKYHHGRKHKYYYSSSIYNADVYISLPKLKTHHKTGVTLNLKGLVGTCSRKNCLVHWRIGFPAIGGDEYPDFLSWLKSKTQKVVFRGAWPGNDTIWRMVVDLYKGIHLNQNQRRFSIIDGIIGGQGKGPFCPRAKKSQVLIGGEDLFAVDWVGTMVMGFDPKKVKYLNYLWEKKGYTENDLHICKDEELEAILNNKRGLEFEPPPGWELLCNS